MSKKLNAEFIFMPLLGTSRKMFGTIPPTDPDDKSQNTPNVWPIVEF